MKFKDARSRALKEIQAEKDAIAARNQEINTSLEQNATAEQARWRQSQISRGEIPDDLKVTISERAQQIPTACRCRRSLAQFALPQAPSGMLTGT